MFIGNHRGFSGHFHRFGPSGGSFGRRPHYCRGGDSAQNRAEATPNTFHVPGPQHQRPLIGKNPSRPARHGTPCSGVLPKARRYPLDVKDGMSTNFYAPSPATPGAHGLIRMRSTIFGHRLGFFLEARRGLKCAPKPPFGDGFGEEPRQLYRVVQRRRWPSA